MSPKIRTVYVVHHSHTDIGYTDLQENVLALQSDHIRQAIALLQKPENDAFRWNCETLFCVERFLKEANTAEREAFFRLVRSGKIGLSGSYLNFCDLADDRALLRRLRQMTAALSREDIALRCAMCADINGISLGQRNALLDIGVEFLYMNIHACHGFYPLYQNQTAFFWEAGDGRRLLCWNGEHYNLGNVLGLTEDTADAPFAHMYVGKDNEPDPDRRFSRRLHRYLHDVEAAGYPYDFLITSVSGRFTDNAPPNDAVLRRIEAYAHSPEAAVEVRMVTLDELYAEIAEKLANAPVWRGDLPDWWASGIGSEPYATKLYRAAQQKMHAAQALDPAVFDRSPALTEEADVNLLLYAEHTFGHSASVSDPFDTAVSTLELGKISYAARAHAAAARLYQLAVSANGGKIHTYAPAGKVIAVNPADRTRTLAATWEIDGADGAADVVDTVTNESLPAQTSRTPRGVSVTVTLTLAPQERRLLRYTLYQQAFPTLDTRHPVSGTDNVADLLMPFDQTRALLPCCAENDWFRILWTPGVGFTSFFCKSLGLEWLADAPFRFFTPVYEHTPAGSSPMADRAQLGRNIRGAAATVHPGVMTRAVCTAQGEVFSRWEFTFSLEGTTECRLSLTLFHRLPRIDFTLKVAKTLCTEIESLYLPLELAAKDRELWLRKGQEAFRPGIDQLPGSGMDYYMTDSSVICRLPGGTVQLDTPDVPLVTLGALTHHPIRLCENAPSDNARPVCSWIMNNLWETNFKLDLSGFGEYRYRLLLHADNDPELLFDEAMLPADAPTFFPEA